VRAQAERTIQVAETQAAARHTPHLRRARIASDRDPPAGRD
jgi:hypothetical protein